MLCNDDYDCIDIIAKSFYPSLYRASHENFGNKTASKVNAWFEMAYMMISMSFFETEKTHLFTNLAFCFLGIDTHTPLDGWVTPSFYIWVRSSRWLFLRLRASVKIHFDTPHNNFLYKVGCFPFLSSLLLFYFLHLLFYHAIIIPLYHTFSFDDGRSCRRSSTANVASTYSSKVQSGRVPIDQSLEKTLIRKTRSFPGRSV